MGYFSKLFVKTFKKDIFDDYLLQWNPIICTYFLKCFMNFITNSPYVTGIYYGGHERGANIY